MAIYIGTVGIKFRVWTGIDMSSGGTASLRITKPSGAVVTWTASIQDATVGRLLHVVGVGEIDEGGTWYVNALWTPTGAPQPMIGRTCSFKVTAPGT